MRKVNVQLPQKPSIGGKLFDKVLEPRMKESDFRDRVVDVIEEQLGCRILPWKPGGMAVSHPPAGDDS